MLELKMFSTKSNTYELYMRIAIKDYLGCESISIYKSNLQAAMDKMPRRSVATVSNCYRLVMCTDEQTLNIWHLTVRGDQDRLVATIIKRKI